MGGEDRQAIRELVDRYSLAVTARDYELLSSCFAPDATWAVGDPVGIGMDGAEAIVKFIAERQAMGSFSFQGVAAMVLDVGDEATARGTVAIHEAALRGDDDTPLKLYGLYRDEYVRIDGAWLFQSRVCEVLHLETGGG
jgi:ketosteroid isomerase-like protein